MRIVQIRDKKTLNQIAELQEEFKIRTGAGLVAHVVRNFARLRQQKIKLQQEVSALRVKLQTIDAELKKSLDEIDTN